MKVVARNIAVAVVAFLLVKKLAEWLGELGEALDEWAKNASENW